jgi:anti-sigma factor RsiW
MSQIIDEQLSALLDGELPAEQEALLLRRLDKEPELREKLARFGMLGELLRDSSAPLSALSVSGRVAAAGAAEEAPSDLPVRTSQSASNRLSYFGAGIAASIAMLVMFNLSDTGNATRQSVIAAVAQSEPSMHEHADVMAVDPARLTRYLVSHSQYTNSASRQLFDSHLAMAVNTDATW